MKIFRRLLLFAAIAFILSALVLQGLTQTSPAPQRTVAGREEAYRANNLGVALLEQYKYKEGAESFTRALQLDPKLAIARINLSIALFNVPDAAGAQREAEKAAALNPNAPQPHYILGLIAKSQNRTDDAIAAFERVLKIDPRDVGANVNIGQLYASARNYTEAANVFRTALEVDPYNMTALYNLGLALTRSNQRAEGQQAIQKFQDLRQRGTGTTIGQNYLEQGRYSEAIASTGAEPELVDKAVPAVTFVDATANMLPAKGSVGAPGPASLVGHRSGRNDLSDAEAREEIAATLGGAVTLFDYDNDGDLDLLRVSPTDQRLYRNDGGKFVDVTEQSGALSAKSISIGTSAVAGDYDNDGKPDIFVMRYGGASLYHNDGNGKFSDATTASGIPNYPYLSSAVAFVDVDHDGDLDIFIGGLADLSKLPKANENKLLENLAGAPNMLLRNDGNGKFTDITAAAKVGGERGRAVAVVPTDYDNHRDIDLLVVNFGKPPDLYSNQRDGSFRNVSREVGLDVGGHWTSAAAGDLNKDGFTDFFFTSGDGPGLFALSDGQGKFKTVPAPAGSGIENVAQFIDYDNDGLLDLLMVTNSVNIWRNLGDGWMNTSERTVARELTHVATDPIDASSRVLASGDLDGDGDTDLILRSASGELKIARNDGGNLNHSLRVNLLGRVSNRSAIGAKIEMRAGSLGQKLETYSSYPAPAPADVVFGLGTRARADAVRVLWPAGIVQAEMEAARAPDPKKTTTTLPITELDKKPSSCPFLYTWNGERFEFITDFMGGGEMGYWESPGHYNTPDPDEYVRIRADQLKERNGRYEIRMTNELEEVLYVDRVQLLAVAHPVGV
ncbi:MAG TPA: FG-GAP-like repeat-containing protein, partial [Pyrinomonadaceae bacterium]|nr:FG-GAP-like repeat-containing protein [Pyrinomonadaceae bacterium]